MRWRVVRQRDLCVCVCVCVCLSFWLIAPLSHPPPPSSRFGVPLTGGCCSVGVHDGVGGGVALHHWLIKSELSLRGGAHLPTHVAGAGLCGRGGVALHSHLLSCPNTHLMASRHGVRF